MNRAAASCRGRHRGEWEHLEEEDFFQVATFVRGGASFEILDSMRMGVERSFPVWAVYLAELAAAHPWVSGLPPDRGRMVELCIPRGVEDRTFRSAVEMIGRMLPDPKQRVRSVRAFLESSGIL